MWRVVLLALLASLIFISCDEDDPKPPALAGSITPASTPTFLLCNSDSLYVFSVRVENFDGLDSVYCVVQRPDGSENAPFRMYDDGGSLNLTWPDYAGTTSGDIVPNNGTYTRAIWSNLLCAGEEGTYRFTFRAARADVTMQTTTMELDVRSPIACLFNSVEHPTEFAQCFEPAVISVDMSEDPEVPLDTVRIQWLSGDTLWWEADLARGNENVWEMEISPSDFQCTPTGTSYRLRFEAYNRFGLSCSRESSGLSFTNGLPVLSNPQLADTLYRPVTPGDSDTLQFFIRNDDCEMAGTAWTQSVFFEVSRDDTLNWGTDPSFFLRDDGVPPDVTRGDGLASSYLVVSHSTTNLNNIYFFKYYSIECSSGDTSVALIDSTRIIQSGTLSGGNGNTLELGIASFK